MNFVKELRRCGRLPKAMTTSFLSLIPKVLDLQNLGEYMPICLVSCMHKLITKILAARLKRVIDKVISQIQLTFIPRRQILDGVLVMNEFLDLSKRDKRECLLFKVDFRRKKI